MKDPLEEAIDQCHANPGQFEIIKTLLEKVGAKVDPKNSKTWTLFILAVYDFYEDPVKSKDWAEVQNAVAKLVIEKGLPVDAVQLPGKETPLILTAHAGNFAVAQFLVEDKKADVNAVDAKGRTPLFLAKEHADQALANYLISKGAKVGVARSEQHMAADHPVLAPPPARKSFLQRLKELKKK